MKSIISRYVGKLKRRTAEPFEIYFGGNKKGCNVLIFTENINATYFISFDIPMRRMHARGEVNVATVSQKFVNESGKGCWESWSGVFKPDVVVMTRYGEPFGVDIVNFFKDHNIPVIYHIDDDLLELPESLGTEIARRQGAVVATRSYIMKHVDMIYASTSHLSKLLTDRFPITKVIHGNIYAPYLGAEIGKIVQANQERYIIGYMGSKGHQHDLELVVPALERLLDERPNLHFEVFGTIKMPEKLLRFGNRVKSRSVQKTYIEFLGTLGNLGWNIGLAPLVNEPFNLCKAPTKFIEYTASGIPVVASDIPVYSDVIPEGGGVLVKKDWYNALSGFLDAPEVRDDTLLCSRLHCEKNFSLSILEEQLKNILFQVVK